MEKTDTKSDWASKDERQKRFATEFVGGWINERLESYEEPKRRGVTKGTRIGASKKQAAAAFYEGLLYPFCSREETAAFAGSTPATVRVWEAQKVFQDLVAQSAADFSRFLCRAIDLALILWAHKRKEISSISEWIDEPPLVDGNNLFEDPSKWIPKSKAFNNLISNDALKDWIADTPGMVKDIVDCIPAFSIWVQSSVRSFLMDQCQRIMDSNKNISVYVRVILWLEAAYVRSSYTQRAFTVGLLSVEKANISGWFDVLMTSKAWTSENAQKSQQYAVSLKNHIFWLLDVLAGKNTPDGEDADVE